MTTAMTPPSAASEKPAWRQQWAPRMWEGCDFFAWMRLLVRNRFAVEWPYLYIAVIVTLVSVLHTLLRFLQEAWYWDRVSRTPIRPSSS